jgi:hypothetical protein
LNSLITKKEWPLPGDMDLFSACLIPYEERKLMD